MTPLGGTDKRIEVSAISLSTIKDCKEQKQVKAIVLGVLDSEKRIVRLHAVQPPSSNNGEKKTCIKHLAKNLQPLALWVHKTSTIVIDCSIDRDALLAMRYKSIEQSTTTGKGVNSEIKRYLHEATKHLFQRGLNILSVENIQLCLNELMWRECYGTTPGKAFNNIIKHIGDQTQSEGAERLINCLSKVCIGCMVWLS